ncbi:MAG: hypothetical protein L0G87_00350 [Renibacterium salmoninarum]|nr:hypothetical protein [Renibacterium salmoninarum]
MLNNQQEAGYHSLNAAHRIKLAAKRAIQGEHNQAKRLIKAARHDLDLLEYSSAVAEAQEGARSTEQELGK